MEINLHAIKRGFIVYIFINFYIEVARNWGRKPKAEVDLLGKSRSRRSVHRSATSCRRFADSCRLQLSVSEKHVAALVMIRYMENINISFSVSIYRINILSKLKSWYRIITTWMLVCMCAGMRVSWPVSACVFRWLGQLRHGAGPTWSVPERSAAGPRAVTRAGARGLIGCRQSTRAGLRRHGRLAAANTSVQRQQAALRRAADTTPAAPAVSRHRPGHAGSAPATSSRWSGVRTGRSAAAVPDWHELWRSGWCAAVPACSRVDAERGRRR